MNDAQVAELLLQALETETGGTEVYETAIKCAVNDDLAEEFRKYLAQTRHHVEVVTAPPEERRDVKTAIGAARAKNAREADLG